MFLCVSDGKVYYIGDKSKAPILCVTTEDEVLDILKQFHTMPLGGAHTGINNTREKISAKYYWPGLTQDIMEYVSTRMHVFRTVKYPY